MPWEIPVIEETGIAEGGSSASYALVQKETAHVQFEREAGTGTTDSMILSVYASTDDVTFDNKALNAYQIPPGTPMPIGTIQVAGVRYFKITMTATGSTDTITVTLRVVRDGGLS